jgi:D-alanine-D-alanine ligase
MKRTFAPRDAEMTKPGRILILWNQVEEDVYERIQADGPRALDWDPDKTAEQMSTAAEELDLIVRSLRDRGHTVSIANIGDSLTGLLQAIDGFAPDVIFNLVEFFGEDPAHEMHVAGVYELLGIAYTGSRPEVLTLCQRKHRTKAILAAADVPTPRYVVVSGEAGSRVPDDHGLRFPLIVKPAMEDASGGIDAGSVVRDRAALDARVTKLVDEYHAPVIVEEYIDGREIHCAIMGNDPPEALPLFEMAFHQEASASMPHIITYKAKWDPHSKDFYAMDGVCPPTDLEPETVRYIQEIAIRAYNAVGCRDYARVDMRVEPESGEPYVLEVNPNPDLSDSCAFVQCAAVSGRTYAQLVDEIARMALTRARAAKPRATGPGDQLLREYLARAPRKKRKTGT